ncbi:hypothetical protein NBRC116592_02840 [Colwellia sp. KU-HH00111]|uniref:hypothetical protein n=1 Tax=Colwellia sp. KU-HH00111 TaxID=3127652 RepID=UPI00310827D7
MQFTLVIFSTYKFTLESVASAKSARYALMPKINAAFNPAMLNFNNSLIEGLLEFKKSITFNNIVLLKELFFTSPQLKITLFKTVLVQFMLITCFCYSKIGIMVNLFNKEKGYVSKYSS